MKTHRVSVAEVRLTQSHSAGVEDCPSGLNRTFVDSPERAHKYLPIVPRPVHADTAPRHAVSPADLLPGVLEEAHVASARSDFL